MKPIVKLVLILSIVISLINYNACANAQDCSTETKLQNIDSMQHDTPTEGVPPPSSSDIFQCKVFTLQSVSCLMYNALVAVYVANYLIPTMWYLTTTCQTNIAATPLTKQQMHDKVENLTSQQHQSLQTHELCGEKYMQMFDVDGDGSCTGSCLGDITFTLYCMEKLMADLWITGDGHGVDPDTINTKILKATKSLMAHNFGPDDAPGTRITVNLPKRGFKFTEVTMSDKNTVFRVTQNGDQITIVLEKFPSGKFELIQIRGEITGNCSGDIITASISNNLVEDPKPGNNTFSETRGLGLMDFIVQIYPQFCVGKNSVAGFLSILLSGKTGESKKQNPPTDQQGEPTINSAQTDYTSDLSTRGIESP